MGEMSVSLLGLASCHTNGYVREEALRDLGKMETTDLVDILRRAFLAADPQVRRLAVLKLGDILPNKALNEFLVRARKDVYMPVRREALRIFVARESLAC
jgi:HEAT repeat protein